MNSRLAVIVMLIVATPTTVLWAKEDRTITWQNFPQACDLTDGAPINDLCFGFVNAVIEVTRSVGVSETDKTHHLFANVCVPLGTTVEQAIEKMRPWLRANRLCAGLCTATGYVYQGLEVAHPCK